MALDLSRIDSTVLQQVVSEKQTRLESMRNYRLSWWAHWSRLAEFFHPRRYRWFVTPNQFNRGSPMNQAIIDETGLLAARTCATGLLSGLTSPSKPWFRLGIHGMDDIDSGPVREWLAECETRMARVYAGSNFYEALGVCYHDLVVFGSAPMIQYEDYQDVVRFYNPALGEFMYGASARLDINVLYREYTYTVAETVEEFKLENCSPQVQTSFKQGGAGLDLEIVIGHCIEPNKDIYRGGESLGSLLPAKFEYRETFWENASGSAGGGAIGRPLRIAGFEEKPFVGGRWDVTSNDPYGRSPGMDALPAVMQLQQEQRRKGQAIDKMVNPPMVASVTMRNEPMSTLPGGISYVTDVANSGFKPAYTVDPRLAEMTQDIEQVQARINAVLFVDLFMMISNLPAQTERTATEIDARREEKLIQLGPVIERFENEVLDPTINRTFNIMSRRGLFPPAPPEIQGRVITVQYISMLAEAQRAATTTAIERVFAFAGSLAALQPQIMDNLDSDEAIDDYANLLGLPAKIVRATKDVLVIRQQRSQQQQQQEQLQTSLAAAQGAQTLSQTDVGGGQNALQKMLGN